MTTSQHHSETAARPARRAPQHRRSAAICSARSRRWRTRAPAPPQDEGADNGFIPYERRLALQLTAAERVRAGDDRGTVLLLKHTPVYTAGRRALPAEHPVDGAPVVQVDRGGKVTWHGPGQLVAYLVVRLRDRLGVVDFIRTLEQVVIEVAAELGLHGFRIPGRAGVWANRGGDGTEEFAELRAEAEAIGFGEGSGFGEAFRHHRVSPKPDL